MPITPFVRANSTFSSSKSTPITLHPFAFNSCAVISPINPNPITTTVSPSCGFNKRIPCKPIDPITVKAASSSETFSGILATKFLGTQTYSACCPLEATRSPTLNSVTPFPTATTIPELQYPKGNGCPNLLKTASNVGCKPSVFILSSTCFTLSGC